MQSRGADPSIRSKDFDPYLNPGPKLPVEVAVEDGPTRQLLLELEEKYASVEKVGEGGERAQGRITAEGASSFPKMHHPSRQVVHVTTAAA